MTKILKVEVEKDYGKCVVRHVLEDLGFIATGRNTYTKEDKDYKFKKADHYNGYFYSVEMEEVEELEA